MLKKLIYMLSLLLCFSLFAQEAETEEAAEGTEEAAAPAAPVDAVVAKFDEGGVKNTLEAFKEKAGLDNENKFMTAIGVAKISKAPNDRQYATARQIAFSVAFTDALQQIAGSIQADMTNAVQSGYIEDEGGLKKTDVDPKIIGMVNDTIKKELQAQGVDLNDPKAIAAAMPKVTGTSSFKQVTEAASQLYLSGVVCAKTVAQGDEIGVLVYYSEMMKKISDSLVARTPMPKIPNGIDIKKYLRSIPANEFSNSFGVRLYVDKKGEPVIVAFGQALLGRNPRSADMAARRLADGFIQDFVGSNFAMSEMVDQAQDSTTLATAAGEMTETNISERRKSMAARVSKKFRYYGITNGPSKVCVLPSGHKVSVVTRMWSPSSAVRGAKAAAAAENSAKLREQAAKKKPAAQKPVVKRPVKRPAPTYKDTANDGAGAGGFIL